MLLHFLQAVWLIANLLLLLNIILQFIMFADPQPLDNMSSTDQAKLHSKQLFTWAMLFAISWGLYITYIILN